MPEGVGLANPELQFDRVAPAEATASTAAAPTVVCTGCQSAITTVYHQINGKPFCSRCRVTIEHLADTPRGMMPLLRAGLFGLGAGIVGAAIYYAVIALANLEIGIIAILIGYMVGYSVRKGAGGRGGRRFQVLAVLLTYLSVALAYTPIAVKQVMDDRKVAQGTSASTDSPAADAQASASSGSSAPRGGGLIVALVVVAGFVLVLPVIVIVGSMPSGLISAAIIFFGMSQAWKMTGRPRIEASGPYQVGAV